MFRKLLTLVGILIFALGMFFVMVGVPKQPKSGLPQVVTSNFALYDIVRHVGEDVVEASMIIPFGQDLHTFNPTPKEIIRSQESLLFIYSGVELEPWSEIFSNMPNAVDISKPLKLQILDDGHNHSGSSIDPHYWLDADNMKIAVDEILKNLQAKVADADKDGMQKRAQEYKDRLDRVDSLYKKRLKNCYIDTIIVNHNAFGYLASRYGFKVESIHGLSSQSESSAKAVAHLVDIASKRQISTVFYDSFSSENAVDSLARESNLKVDRLFTIANIKVTQKGADYFFLANQNLHLLRKAMGCR